MGSGGAVKQQRETQAVEAKTAATSSAYDQPRADPLTPREHEITRLVAKGLPNKTIAGVLDMSPWTVATHLRRVFAKLGVNSRAAMVARLFELRYSRPAGD